MYNPEYFLSLFCFNKFNISEIMLFRYFSSIFFKDSLQITAAELYHVNRHGQSRDLKWQISLKLWIVKISRYGKLALYYWTLSRSTNLLTIVLSPVYKDKTNRRKINLFSGHDFKLRSQRGSSDSKWRSTVCRFWILGKVMEVCEYFHGRILICTWKCHES